MFKTAKKRPIEVKFITFEDLHSIWGDKELKKELFNKIHTQCDIDYWGGDFFVITTLYCKGARAIKMNQHDVLIINIDGSIDIEDKKKFCLNHDILK